MSDVQQDSNTWNCLECSVNNDESILLDMDYAAMKKHMKDFHSIDISGKKGQRDLQMHLDDADFHLTQYEWTIEGIKLVQSIKVMRQSYKDRMARKELKNPASKCKTCGGKTHNQLNDDDKFPFGKYLREGKTFKEVPAEYMDWLHGQKWIKEWPAVLDYIERNRKAIDVEMKRNSV